jgi:outer membrane protein TolC
MMPRRFIRTLSLLTLTILAGCATPQDPTITVQLAEISQMDLSLPESGNVGSITLEQAIARASASSDEVAGLVATVNVVAKEKLASGDLRDPELRVGIGEDDGDSDRVRTIVGPSADTETGSTTRDQSAYSLALRMFPRSPWTRNARLSAGRAKIFAAVADLLQARWDLENDVRRLFAELHFLNQDKALMDELTGIYRVAVENARQGYQADHMTVAHVMTASRRYLGTMSDRDEVTRRRANARRKLATLVALSTDDLHIDFATKPAAELPFESLTTKALESQALNHRRDLAVLYWQKASAEAMLREARADRRPWFTFVEGAYGKRESSMNRRLVGASDTTLTADDGDETEWGIRTGITLPLFPWANHSVDVRQAQYRRAAIHELRAREQVKRDIQNAVTALTEISKARETYRRDTNPLIQEMDKVLKGIESVEGLDPTDVARLRGQILESRRLNLESELEYRLAVIALEDAVGLRLGE